MLLGLLFPEILLAHLFPENVDLTQGQHLQIDVFGLVRGCFQSIQIIFEDEKLVFLVLELRNLVLSLRPPTLAVCRVVMVLPSSTHGPHILPILICQLLHYLQLPRFSLSEHIDFVFVLIGIIEILLQIVRLRMVILDLGIV